MTTPEQGQRFAGGLTGAEARFGPSPNSASLHREVRGGAPKRVMTCRRRRREMRSHLPGRSSCSMTTENSKASRSSRLWSDVGEQFCPATAPLLLEQYCCSHSPDTDDGAALGRTRFGAMKLTVQKFQSFLATGEMRAAFLPLASYVLAGIGVQCFPVHWVVA